MSTRIWSRHASLTAADQMRVLLASQEYPPDNSLGGIGSYTHGLARALARAGCEVHVVSCVESQPSTIGEEEGVTVHRTAPNPPHWLGWRLRDHLPQLQMRLAIAIGVARVVRSVRPDVVEAPDWMAEGLLCALTRHPPLVVHIHASLDLVTSHRRGKPTIDTRLAGRAEKLAVRAATAVTAADPRVLNLVTGNPWLGRHVTTIPPPLPAELAAEADGLPPGGASAEPVVAMIGRLDRLKAPELLLEAVESVREEVPDVRIVMAGQANASEAPDGGDYADWIARTARQKGLVVELIGRKGRAEVLDLYRQVRVVAVPSLYESFSMTALEALGSGVPAVVSSSCGIASWLSPLGPGWVFESGRSDALRDALVSRLLDDERWDKDRRAGWELAHAQFSPAKIAAARLALYESLL